MKIEKAKILITGGSSGIGKATAKRLVEAGAQVLITGRSAERLQKAAAESGAEWLISDLSKPEDIDAAWQWVQDHWAGELDVLINNAGLGEFSSVDSTPMESYMRVFNVNTFGPIRMVKRFLPAMLERKSGSIVNVASTSSMKGFANGSAYAASKFALRGFTQSLMEEVRPFNIRVFQVNPSEVSTALGNPEREERKEQPSKLGPDQLAQAIFAILSLPEKAFVPELSVWATNPKT